MAISSLVLQLFSLIVTESATMMWSVSPAVPFLGAGLVGSPSVGIGGAAWTEKEALPTTTSLSSLTPGAKWTPLYCAGGGRIRLPFGLLPSPPCFRGSVLD